MFGAGLMHISCQVLLWILHWQDQLLWSKCQEEETCAKKVPKVVKLPDIVVCCMWWCTLLIDGSSGLLKDMLLGKTV